MYDYFLRNKIFTLITNKIFLQPQQIIKKLATCLAHISYRALIACFISYECWVQREKKCPFKTHLPHNIVPQQGDHV